MAYVARVDEFDCGIMISASHNPYFDNGIKLINGNGEKMDEETISLVEAYLDGNLEVFGQKWEEMGMWSDKGWMPWMMPPGVCRTVVVCIR